MYEVVLVIYIVLNGTYQIYAVRKHEGGQDFLVNVGLPIGRLLSDKVIVRMVSAGSQNKIVQLYGSDKKMEGIRRYQYNRIGIIYLVFFLGGLSTLVIGKDYSPSSSVLGEIHRPAYGEGSQNYNLFYRIGEGDDVEEGILSLLVDEQLPDESKAKEILVSAEPLLREIIFSDRKETGDSEDNDDLMAVSDTLVVTDDLQLPKTPFSQQIHLTYRSLTPDLMTDRGQLRRNLMVPGEEYDMTLEVMAAYGPYTAVYHYPFVAVRAEAGVSEAADKVETQVEYGEQKVLLPLSIDDHPVRWEQAERGISGLQVCLVTVLVALLLYILKEKDLTDELTRRQEAILLDFPEVVNKLTILIGAGMTFTRAWQKVVEDYQNRLGEKRPIYEEMVQVSVALHMGVPLADALQSFGRRCSCSEVIRLSSVLIQNVKLGNEALSDSLQSLAAEAWDVRISMARKMGEKASTKLLIPMAISLLTVLLVVIAPTFMKMQL